MKFLSVCSGIEAASVAWNPIGWKATGFSEIEKFPCAALAHHYPTVPNLGDMTKFKEWTDANFDVLCGGTPCQSFSVAGLRKGLDDPRGNLMLTFGAIAGRYRPRWLVWENVAGVLSSNRGRDFGTFLGLLGILGYGFAYRLYDAQYFGVAQRRRRVFVVGYLGDWRPAAAVLFERHSLQGHPAPRREARKDLAGTLDARTKGGGFPGTDGALDGHVVAHTTGAGYWQEGFGTLRGRAQESHEHLVAHSLRGEGFDASEDGTGRGIPLVADTLRSGSSSDGDGDGDGDGAILVPMAIGVNGGDVGFSLRSNPSHSGDKGDGGVNTTMVCLPINTQIATRHKAMGEKTGLGIGDNGDPDFTLQSAHSHAVSIGMAVRRLTPRECERLQGFPDNYTAIPFRGKPAADGPRYKALGNSWAVPNARWIGRRIDMVAAILGGP